MIVDLKELKKKLDIISNFNQYGRITLDTENKKILITAYSDKLTNIQLNFSINYNDEVNENEI